MRFAVLSDIHANLPALEAVFAELDYQEVDKVLHLGDVVGYGPDPEACARLLRERGVASVLGNHDYAMIRPTAKAWFNASSRKAVDITDGLVSDETRDWLRTLPSSICFDTFRFVHGVPRDNAFLYLFALDDERLARAFAAMQERICFVGHTHMLELVTEVPKGIRRQPLAMGVTELDPGKRYIINIGSVGQPRDDVDNRAKFAIFDTEDWSLDMRGAEYDYKPVAKRIRELGIPDTYAARLAGPGNL